MVMQKDDVEPLAGYLSLHQSAAGISLKWTPNQLMNGGAADEDDSSIDRRFVSAFICLMENWETSSAVQPPLWQWDRQLHL